MRFSRRTIFGVAVLTALPYLDSCASVPASRVSVVRGDEGARIGPLVSCGYIGTVETSAFGATEATEVALRQLREEAGRRGANTVVVRSGPGPLRGTAFLCPVYAPDALQTAGGNSTRYGPDPPSVQGYPKGALDAPADPRH